MNIRELYSRSIRGGKGIDTGFGVSLSGHSVGGMTDMGGGIVFADVGPAGEGFEGAEDMRLETR